MRSITKKREKIDRLKNSQTESIPEMYSYWELRTGDRKGDFGENNNGLGTSGTNNLQSQWISGISQPVLTWMPCNIRDWMICRDRMDGLAGV